MSKVAQAEPAPPLSYIVLNTLENEHAESFDEAFHYPGVLLDVSQLRPESIPILLELGIIAPALAPHNPE